MTTAIFDDARAGTATSTLHMVRADIDALQFRRWMGSRRIVDDDHAMHCLLTECFGKDRDKRPQPFRLMLPRDGRRGALYGYSRADADALREMASMCACPLQEKAMSPASIDSKPMPSEWQTGRRLGFEVRIRPMRRSVRRGVCERSDRTCRELRLVRKKQCENCRPNPEQDAFLYEALTHADKHGMEHTKRSRETVYAEWLQKRIECKGGAVLDLETVKMASFRRTRAVRKLHQRYSEGPDALMRGELEITDGAKFAEMLAGGIGRHKAYGYGMLLLRPAASHAR